ncbi:glycosyltransferase family 4 protein [Corynebacterium sp. A21]|uniref:glycosyltransferase family 4 protein n=1 Tax=Corynebacterium sp. A21 TaxID=3457318 RepID=UPI003FD3B4BE
MDQGGKIARVVCEGLPLETLHPEVESSLGEVYPLKITYIHQHFVLPSEGGGIRPYEFARRMADEGHEVTMICGGETALDAKIDGFRVKRLAVPYRNAMNVPERLWSFARFMIAASVATARIEADVIYASSTPLTVAVPGIIGKLFRRAPMVFEVRDLWPSVPVELGYLKNPAAVWLAQTLEKLAYRSADSVVALSPGMRDGVLQISPEKAVTIIPNACDFELFDQSDEQRHGFRESQGWGEDEIIVAYAGGFGPVYQLDWVVRLAASVKDDGIRFVLIGEGKTSGVVHQLAAELGLDPDELFLGLKSKPEVASYVAASDLVLSPLRPETGLEANSLNKVFDGMAAGRGVVLNHEGWLRDTIVEAHAGWQLDRSLDLAAEQLRTIAADPEAIKAAGRNSAALGHANFDRDDLYRQLIGVLSATVSTRATDRYFEHSLKRRAPRPLQSEKRLSSGDMGS